MLAAAITGFTPSAPLLAAGNPLLGMFGIGFVDLNGDGINDNAPDADANGIPNGQDANYVRPQDGSGSRFGKASGSSATGSTSTTATGTCNGTGPKGNTKGR